MNAHANGCEISPKNLSTSVFTYGTLMSERVLQVVLGRVPVWSHAELDGFARVPLGNERCYPGALVRPGAKIRGRILHGVNADELARLDRFEGDEYEPVVVEGIRLDSGALVDARVWKLAQFEGILDGQWDYNKFVLEDEHWYVQMCKEWAHDDEIEQQKCTPQRRGGL